MFKIVGNRRDAFFSVKFLDGRKDLDILSGHTYIEKKSSKIIIKIIINFQMIIT